MYFLNIYIGMYKHLYSLVDDSAEGIYKGSHLNKH